ncbi:MAG TPA: HAMP domain-containing sensor histidine kinase [Acidimicrobiales bacterium]|nr:HAMP domain-containing sensor histidine kinase [Acidimicrobiales bacterium]
MTKLRSTLRDPALERTGAAQLRLAALLAIPIWAALTSSAIGLTGRASQPSRTSTVILSMLAGELALGAALVSGIRAWVGREIAPLLAAAGLCAYGVGSLAEAASTTIGSWSAGRWFSSASLSLALGLLFMSVVSRKETDQLRRQGFIWIFPFALVALLVGALWDQNSLLATAWAFPGLIAIWTGRREREPLKIWIGFTMLFLAQGSLAVSVLPAEGLAQLGSHVLRVVATTLILLGTIRALQETVGDHQSQVVETLLAFHGSEAQRQSEEHAHQEAVHNLRSALGAITLASHALVFSGKSDSLSDDERIHLARALESSLERARRLIAREWASVRQTFPLLDLVMPAVVRERSSGIAIDVDVPPGTVVRGDRGRTAEVLEAILDNARRYAPGSRLTIRVIADDPWVTLVIGDRGPGLPLDSLEKIFERGWTTAVDGEGAGIGLHVARCLMEEQGGSLRAANRSGGGAVFLARFQKAKSEPQPNLKGSVDAAMANTIADGGDDQRLVSV